MTQKDIANCAVTAKVRIQTPDEHKALMHRWGFDRQMNMTECSGHCFRANSSCYCQVDYTGSYAESNGKYIKLSNSNS